MAITLAQAAMVARAHWGMLSAGDRARLQALVGKALQGPSTLTKQERAELRHLVGKLDPLRFTRSVVTGHRSRTA
jgi:hypothetical protein